MPPFPFGEWRAKAKPHIFPPKNVLLGKKTPKNAQKFAKADGPIESKDGKDRQQMKDVEGENPTLSTKEKWGETHPQRAGLNKEGGRAPFPFRILTPLKRKGFLR